MRKHLATYASVLALTIALACTPISMDYPSYGVFMNSLDRVTRERVKKFKNICEDTRQGDTFIYFTDPHIYPQENTDTTYEEKHFNSKFSVMKNIFNYLPVNCCICGGDWITKGDYQDFAKAELQFAKHYMDKWFQSFYTMLGNHDTNYCGTVSKDNAGSGNLPLSFFEDTLFAEHGHAYYSFSGKHTGFYILDSGNESEANVSGYRSEQIEWLANRLLTDNYGHAVLGFHMFYDHGHQTAFSEIIVTLAEAFNKRESFSFNGIEYDFSGKNGRIIFILVGHNHEDYITEEHGIPIISTCCYSTNGRSTFDLCMIDYDSDMLKLVRIGNGESRSLPLLDAER